METSKGIEQLQKEAKELENFREELTVLVGDAKKREMENNFPDKEKGNLASIDPNFLNQADCEIWKLFQEQKLTKKVWNEYEKNIHSEDKSRIFYRAYLAGELVRPKNMKWFNPEDYEYLKKHYEKNGLEFNETEE